MTKRKNGYMEWRDIHVKGCMKGKGIHEKENKGKVESDRWKERRYVK